MKALRGKKAFLRSFLRWGIVVLGAIALTLAGCSSGDDEEGAGNPDRGNGDNERPLSVTINGNLGKVYQGMPLNLDGITATVVYKDRTETITDTSQFVTKPKYGTGYYDPVTKKFTGIAAYEISYTKNGVGEIKSFSPTTIGIVRDNTEVMTYFDPFAGPPGGSAGGRPSTGVFFSDNGLDVTGMDKVKKVYYVDEVPSFEGLTVEATYEDGNKFQIPLIPLRDGTPDPTQVRWWILPKYNNNGGKDTGSGELVFTLGINPDIPTGGPRDPGVTKSIPINTVYHVKDIAFTPGLAPKVEKGKGDFFYFDKDESATWVQKIGEAGGASIDVTYSNGVVTPYTVSQLNGMNSRSEVWWNANPGDTATPFYIMGIVATNKMLGGRGTTLSDIREPKIQLYYRGYYLAQPWPVYTRLVNLEATINKEGLEAVPVNMLPLNNDFRDPHNASTFSGAITVKATYRAFSNADLETTKTVIWKYATEGDVPGGAKTDPDSYTMDFGLANAKGNPGWGQCSMTTNNGRDRPVTIYYANPEYTNDPVVGTITSSVRRYRVTATWENILAP